MNIALDGQFNLLSCVVQCNRDTPCLGFGFKSTTCIVFIEMTAEQEENGPSDEGFIFYMKDHVGKYLYIWG